MAGVEGSPFAPATSIFETMSHLARTHEAINLGQGFPDEDGPEDIRRVAAQALIDGPNQYPPMLGVPELREAVAEHTARFYGLELDPAREIMVTTGATEALAASFLGLLAPGDEAVVIEPLFDTYVPMIHRAGATPRAVRLEPPEWTLTSEALEAAFSSRTRLLVLNDPQNPAAKVYTPAELTLIADVVKRHDAVVVCDEAYEHLVFDGRAHVPLATLPGMAERCLRISSAGKTFSVTGWKVGYVGGPADLVSAIARSHQNLVFTTPPALQRAVAYGLRKDAEYFEGLRDGLQAKRDRLSAGLTRLGFDVLPCQGTYFVNASFARLGIDGDDAALCRTITVEARVAAIPVSAFYHGPDAPSTTVRFCFSKRDEVLDEALERLARFLG
jgi:N-succinyldiaminopimelate aminotransferase